MIRLCIAEHQPVVVDGLTSFFDSRGKIEVLVKARNRQELFDKLLETKVDVLLIEITFDGMDGMKDLQILMKRHPAMKVIIFSNLAEEMYAPNAIKAGVSAFINKKAELELVYDYIQKSYFGEKITSPFIEHSLKLIAKQNKNNRLYRKLSNREIQVLQLMGNGLKNKEVAQKLDLNEKTISTYKLRLLSKLQVSNTIDMVEKARHLDIIQ
jgi:DNA-binding NarL/FixJ family response regulator